MVRRVSAITTSIVTITSILLSACGSTEPIGTSTPNPSTQPSASSNQLAAPVELEPEPPDVLPPSECTLCHQDKDALIDTAEPEEEVISENEGEG